jgi:hypothetical protein
MPICQNANLPEKNQKLIGKLAFLKNALQMNFRLLTLMQRTGTGILGSVPQHSLVLVHYISTLAMDFGD